ncbi:hypothetical protein SAMD00019534_114660 [Acytostelium subglobosum LB1]|uniref:hypothetical protein n=1 Tax=Acytostelium subglobosum LB1 TaxID=1410327 RepID=UPI00064506D5|nr:hypothetical protein SAMD00019534_114660 [Acytostelium subglobosum LB1]GAM28290.1 hypothetical protein SAMD00019534_114660 [Acytostelium subglobosum LB1]|eukprot:XP_012748924.1 hypothetical protein SAMD00019534_114660 [Acytostelium subglobosum LB1]
MPNEIEDVKDPLKRLSESLKIFSVHKKECNKKIKALSKCHSLVSDVAKSQSLTSDLAKSTTKSSLDTLTKDNSNIKLALYGPTHSGKSTLINTMLAYQLMPSGGGHTSGRICILAHSHLIRIRFFTIIPAKHKQPSMLECIHSQTVTIESKEFNLETKKELQALMRKHLARPEGIDKDPVAFEEWASKIVRVEFPSTLLETGLEIIDLPGFSVADDSSLFTIRNKFFNVCHPTGVLFCYANAFSDAEVMAVKDLHKSLPSIWTPTKEFIFFVNTKTSKSEVALNNSIDPSDEVPLELIHSHTNESYDKLKSSSLKDSSMSIDARRFTIVNATDYLRPSKSGENKYIFNQFVDRLIRWLARLYQLQGELLLKFVELECHSMFLKVDTLHLYIGKDMKLEVLFETTDILLDKLYHVLLHNGMKEVIERIPEDIKVAMTETANYDRILEIEQTIDKVSIVNDKSQKFKMAMRQFFEDVMEKLIKQVGERVSNVVDTATNSLLLGHDQDFSVKLIKDTLDQIEWYYSAPFKSILSKAFMGIISSNIYKSYIRHFKVPVLLRDLKGQVAKYPKPSLVVKLAEQVNSDMSDQIEMVKNIRNTVYTRLRQRLTISSDSLHNIDNTKEQYRSLYYDTLASTTRLHFPFDSIEVDRSKVMGYSDLGPVYNGTFRDQSFYVQVIQPTLDVQQNLSKVTWFLQLGKGANTEVPMLPLLAVFHEDGDGANSNRLLVYKKCEPLKPYLMKNISKLTLVQSLAMITRLVKALEFLHSGVFVFRFIIHEFFSLEFMYIDTETNDIYLSMFGNHCEQLVNGDPTKLSKSTDLEDLGIVILELLPKENLQRYKVGEVHCKEMGMRDIKDNMMIPTLLREPLIELIILCFNHDMTIKDVFSKLEDINKLISEWTTSINKT